MTRRTRELIFALLLIGIGVIVLLGNTGVLSAGKLRRLGDLWPLILVALGIQLVAKQLFPRAQARLVGLAAVAVIVVAALVWAILAPAAPEGSQHQESSAALTGMTAATLDLSYSGATVEVQSAALEGQLYRAQVDYPSGEQPPDVTVDRGAGTLEISGGGFFGFHLFGGRGGARHIVVILTSQIPWTIQISGRAATMSLQLGSLKLTKVEISGGAGRLDITLPRPKGTLAVNISGGATSLNLRAPAVEWQLYVSGGVSSLDVNGARSGAVGSLQHHSAGYSAATDRLNVDVSGGVSSVQLRTG